MNTLLLTMRARLRRLARLAAQAANVLDMLNLDFLAHLARVALAVAMLLLLLLTLLARVTVNLAVTTFRVLRWVGTRTVAAFSNVFATALLLTYMPGDSLPEWMLNIKHF